jgi:hypothetical protein
MDVGGYLILLESCDLVAPGFKTATNSGNDTFSRPGLREGVAVRHDGQAGFIYFEEHDGEWRISEM